MLLQDGRPAVTAAAAGIDPPGAAPAHPQQTAASHCWRPLLVPFLLQGIVGSVPYASLIFLTLYFQVRCSSTGCD